MNPQHLETSRSHSPAMSIASTHDVASLHSSISDDSKLNDHRHQVLTLPVRTDTRRLSENSAPSPVLRSTLHASLREDQLPSPALGQTPAQQQVQAVGKRSDLMLNSRDLRDRMNVLDDDSDDDDKNYLSKLQTSIGRHNSQQNAYAMGPSPPARAKTRTSSFSDQVKSFIRPREESVTGGILLGANNNNSSVNVNNGSSVNTKSPTSGNAGVTIVNTLNRTVSRASTKSDRSKKRRTSSSNTNRESVEIDSDLDSHASRDSQETEEDVCFPMLPEHIRIKGIDFDEIEEFIHEQREENEIILKREEELRNMGNSSTTSVQFGTGSIKYTSKYSASSTEKKQSAASLRYTPKSKANSTTSGSASITDEKVIESSSSSLADNNNVTFGNLPDMAESGVDRQSSPPDRFSFFSSENEETIHAPDFPSLVKPGQPFKSLFKNNANNDAIWWLDCVCPTDNEMKMLAKAFGIHPLTAEDIRMQETREKVELFKSYYFVCFHSFETDPESEDFLEPINVYIVVFREGILTFHFSPINHPANVRRRMRQLRDYVNVSADWLCYALIDDITDGFAPVIHAIEYEADAIEDSVFLTRENDFGTMLLKIGESRRKVMTLMRLLQGKADVIKMFAKRCQDEATRPLGSYTNLNGLGAGAMGAGMGAGAMGAGMGAAQPRADIALYLGDIQDHIITMFQSLMSYEKIFSRSHANYLAQLQVESFNSNNKVTEMLSKVTLLGTVLVPMNLVTGLFGMNVTVPGENQGNVKWWFGILGFVIGMVIVCLVGANYYLKSVEDSANNNNFSNARSIKSFGFGRKRNYNPGTGRTDRSLASLPTKFTRYGGDW
ncbi:unnamed protein product [Ambrosiozyma monospora]|uniref:Unnamed protein product n=1 Tax=Ambrosiozyma monospora TaxID=43982 RepID=A0A9W7DIK5_AMBMO|nr:unnamed protein product [Ambrosiozyma monospora]